MNSDSLSKFYNNSGLQLKIRNLINFSSTDLFLALSNSS